MQVRKHLVLIRVEGEKPNFVFGVDDPTKPCYDRPRGDKNE